MKLKVTSQGIEVTDKLIELVSATENIYQAEFTFDDSWDGFSKTACFKIEGGNSYSVILSNNKCAIPNEVVANSKYIYIGVLGTKTVDSTTFKYPTVWTSKLWVDIGCVASGTPAPPTADVYAQILSAYEATNDRLDDVEDDIETLDGRLDTAESDITTLENGKVDKVDGKGLSTNDYTDNEKLKVSESYLAKHTHNNKGVLDTIDSEDIVEWNSKSTVSVSASGTATDEVGYITVNGVEKKLAGGGAVDSVNGKTGTVVLDAEDVGALPDDTPIPSKTSDITNDSGFITNAVNDLVNYTKTSDLAEVATSGDYDDLSNTPDVYTKTEADALLINKQDKTSNLLNTTSKEVVGAINEVNSSVGNKVDKVNGKGLSTNDYDNTEKQKVADAYNDKHTHSNMSILNSIGSDANGLYWED